MDNIHVGERDFQKKKDLTELKRKDKSLQRSITGIACYYFLFLVIIVLSIISVAIIVGSVLGISAIYTTNGVLGFLFPFSGMGFFIGGLCVLLSLIAWCLIICLPALSAYDPQKSKIDSFAKVKKYTKMLMTNNKITGGDLYVECFHYEMKQYGYRYVTQEKIVTAHKTFKLKYDNVVDTSFYPDFDSINHSKFKLDTSFRVKIDPQSEQIRQNLLEQVKKQYQGKDKEMDIYFTAFKIKGIHKIFNFRKSAQTMIKLIVDNPCTVGLFFYFSCLYVPISILFNWIFES